MPKMQEVPAASSFQNPRKAGYLDKLTGKSWLYSGSWKKRFCVLDGTKLYYYEGKESKGSERSSGVISLDYYDLCEEASPKECKRATNVFILSTSVRGFFNVRYMFAAETLDEMRNWVIHIKAATNDARKNRSRAGRARRSTSRASARRINDVHDTNGSLKESGEDGVFSDVPTQDVEPLQSATKNRPRGPQGRRLPHRKTLMPRDEEDKGRCRASSLSEIECGTMEDTTQRSYDWKTRSVELDLDDNSHMTCAVNQCLAYEYSSSDADSMHSEVEASPESTKSPSKDKSLRRACLHPFSGKSASFHSSETATKRVTLMASGSNIPSTHTPDELAPAKNRSKFARSMVGGGDKLQMEQLVKELEKKWSDKYKRCSKDEQVPKNHTTSSVKRKSEAEPTTETVFQLNGAIRDVEKELAMTKNDLGSVQENLRDMKTDADSTNEKVRHLTTQVQELEKQVASLLKAQKEVGVTLKEVAQEREDLYRLKEQCQELLSLHTSKNTPQESAPESNECSD